MISVQGVSKVYEGPRGGIVALRDVSLNIEEGEFVAVMGASGSGKSTMLSLLGAMSPPTRGHVVVDGIDLYTLSTDKLADFRHRYLGFVFQQLQLVPYLTAIENVMVPLVVGDQHGSRLEAAARALGSVGLRDRMLQLPDQLSGGEQGRVAIARAVVNDPPILLADEPTGNLDSGTGEEIMRLLRSLNEKGHTIVMVTHSAEAAAFARRVIVLRDGIIVDEQRGKSEAHHPRGPEPVAITSPGSEWSKEADLAAVAASEAENADAEDGSSDWWIITLLTLVAAAIMLAILFLVPGGEAFLHAH